MVSEVKGQKSEACIVQNAAEYASTLEPLLLANIKAVQLTQQQIDSVNEKLNPWEDKTTADIPGIRSMHVGCYCT